MILSIATYFTIRRLLKKEKFKTNPFAIRRYLLKKAISIYTVSPSLFEEPAYWGENASVVGFVERDKCVNWQPNTKLLSFLKSYEGDKIVFITFGSISNSAPEVKTRAILKAIAKYKVPTIINISWGGLIEVETYPEHVLFVKNIPYDWIFPKVYGVIHHGGVGTTHSAIKYGCSSLIIPHFIDQFFWSKTIVKMKLGPKGMSIKDLDESNFEQSLLSLISNDLYKKNAEKLSKRIVNEFSITRLLNKLRK